MAENEKRWSGLERYSLEELGAMWDEADNKGRSQGFTSGQISGEMQKRAGNVGQTANRGVTPDHSPAKTVKSKRGRHYPGISHPIDGSAGMRVINKIGMQRARSKQ